MRKLAIHHDLPRLIEALQAHANRPMSICVCGADADSSLCSTKSDVSAHQLDLHIITHQQVRHMLGREFDIVIYDVTTGFQASAWLILAGLVKGSGALFFVQPPNQPVPSGLTFSYPLPTPNSCLFEQISRDLTMATGSDIKQLCSDIADFDAQAPWHKHLDQAKAAQTQCFKRTIYTLTHSHHHVLITAERGRGKSHLLGLIGQALCAHLRIGVVAQSQAHIKTLLAHFEQKAEHISILPMDAWPSYRSEPDMTPEFDVLVMDEAASFPVEVLQQWTRCTQRLLLATTVHGYEGTGMGFTQRFIPWLKAQSEVTHIKLTHPFRFMTPCPIETVCAQFVQFDMWQSAPVAYDDGIHYVDRQAFLHDNNLLRAVMSVLSLAHYQTTPDDIQRMLESPDMWALVYVQNQRVIGCVWVIVEGTRRKEPLSNSLEHKHVDGLKQNDTRCGDISHLAAQITNGSRRVSGHLVLQQLAHSYALPVLLGCTVWRINRIAVLPEMQNTGVGSQLLTHLKHLAQHSSAARPCPDALVSSFGAQPRLLDFWRQHGYTLCKQGVKPNKATGLCNAIVMQPLAGFAEYRYTDHVSLWSVIQTCHTLEALWQQKRSLPIQLLQDIEPLIMQRIAEFVAGTRALEYTESALYAFFVDDAHADPVIQARYQNHWSIAQCCDYFKLAGRKGFARYVQQQVCL